MGEEVNQCEARQAFEEAPRLPAGGTSSAAAFNKSVRVDLLLLDDIIALHAMDTSLMALTGLGGRCASSRASRIPRCHGCGRIVALLPRRPYCHSLYGT